MITFNYYHYYYSEYSITVMIYKNQKLKKFSIKQNYFSGLIHSDTFIIIHYHIKSLV